jgi:hypothetical protein
VAILGMGHVSLSGKGADEVIELEIGAAPLALRFRMWLYYVRH